MLRPTLFKHQRVEMWHCRFCEAHSFEKPNDEKGLQLMDRAAEVEAPHPTSHNPAVAWEDNDNGWIGLQKYWFHTLNSITLLWYRMTMTIGG